MKYIFCSLKEGVKMASRRSARVERVDGKPAVFAMKRSASVSLPVAAHPVIEKKPWTGRRGGIRILCKILSITESDTYGVTLLTSGQIDQVDVPGATLDMRDKATKLTFKDVDNFVIVPDANVRGPFVNQGGNMSIKM
jgi:hypothetical protein